MHQFLHCYFVMSNMEPLLHVGLFLFGLRNSRCCSVQLNFDAFRLLGLVNSVDTFDGFSNFMKVSTLRSLCNSLQTITYINVEKASKFCFVHQLGHPQRLGG